MVCDGSISGWGIDLGIVRGRSRISHGGAWTWFRVCGPPMRALFGENNVKTKELGRRQITSLFIMLCNIQGVCAGNFCV